MKYHAFRFETQFQPPPDRNLEPPSQSTFFTRRFADSLRRKVENLLDEQVKNGSGEFISLVKKISEALPDGLDCVDEKWTFVPICLAVGIRVLDLGKSELMIKYLLGGEGE